MTLLLHAWPLDRMATGVEPQKWIERASRQHLVIMSHEMPSENLDLFRMLANRDDSLQETISRYDRRVAMSCCQAIDRAFKRSRAGHGTYDGPDKLNFILLGLGEINHCLLNTAR